MVKTLYKCVICKGMGKVNICRRCLLDFCDSCLDKIHQGVEYTNEFNGLDERVKYIDYCPYKCMDSKTINYCFDCGESYINMHRCLCCRMVSCSSCIKRNLLDKKTIPLEKQPTAKLFCSKNCYEIYMEDPNNDWAICEECGSDYFDITYKKMCDGCLNKYNYNKDVLFEEKRRDLVDKFNRYLEVQKMEVIDVSDYLQEKVKVKCFLLKSIQENKVTLEKWLSTKNVGNNLCYNIWDEVIETYLLNKFTQYSYI